MDSSSQKSVPSSEPSQNVESRRPGSAARVRAVCLALTLLLPFAVLTAVLLRKNSSALDDAQDQRIPNDFPGLRQGPCPERTLPDAGACVPVSSPGPLAPLVVPRAISVHSDSTPSKPPQVEQPSDQGTNL